MEIGNITLSTYILIIDIILTAITKNNIDSSRYCVNSMWPKLKKSTVEKVK